MNNLPSTDRDPSQPHVILNADNMATGELMKRQGKTLLETLPGAHSLWANRDVMFVVAKGVLYRYDGDLHEITAVGADGPTYYATVRTEAEQSVYVAAPGMLGRYDLTANVMNTWGTTAPLKPTASIVTGELQPGQYHVCYTRRYRHKTSAPGPTATFDLQEGQGLFLTNIGDNDVWITDPGGGELQYLGMQNVIIRQPTGGEPLTILNTYPPAPGLSFIWWVFGRMWGFEGERLVYSIPFDPELFRQNDFFDMGAPGTMIAPVNGGIYAATDEQTFFFQGRNPQNMNVLKVGDGAVRKSLGFVHQLPEIGSNVPVWMSKTGIYAGTADGQVINLTQRKVKLSVAGNSAAAIGRERNGDVQYLTSFKRKANGTGAQFGDSATAEVFRNGKLI